MSDSDDTSELDRIWEDDKLGRKDNAQFLQDFIEGSFSDSHKNLDRKSLVINLKGEWGSGKTFFLQRFAEQLRHSKFFVVEVDAWRCDQEADPLVAIISEIQDQIEDKAFSDENAKAALKDIVLAGGRIVGAVAKAASKQLAKRYLGAEFIDEFDVGNLSAEDRESLEEAAGEVSSSAIEAVFSSSRAINAFKAEITGSKIRKKAISDFALSFEKFAYEVSSEEKTLPVVVLVDELDRCDPAYSLKFLERMNHLFDCQNVVFVVGSDTDQLECSIKSVHGEGFDSKRYLDRFFNVQYTLPKSSRIDFSKYWIQNFGIQSERYCVLGPWQKPAEQFLAQALSETELSTRELKKIIYMLKVFESTSREKQKIEMGWAFLCLLIVHSGGGTLWGRDLLQFVDEHKFLSLPSFDEKLKYFPDGLQAEWVPLRDVVERALVLSSLTTRDLNDQLNGRDNIIDRYLVDTCSIMFDRKRSGYEHRNGIWEYLYLMNSADSFDPR